MPRRFKVKPGRPKWGLGLICMKVTDTDKLPLSNPELLRFSKMLRPCASQQLIHTSQNSLLQEMKVIRKFG